MWPHQPTAPLARRHASSVAGTLRGARPHAEPTCELPTATARLRPDSMRMSLPLSPHATVASSGKPCDCSRRLGDADTGGGVHARCAVVTAALLPQRTAGSPGNQHTCTAPMAHACSAHAMYACGAGDACMHACMQHTRDARMRRAWGTHKHLADILQSLQLASPQRNKVQEAPVTCAWGGGPAVGDPG